MKELGPDKRMIVIADSMALPRLETAYEDTWIYMLKQALPGWDVIDRASRGATSFRLVSEGGGGVDLLELYRPAVVVLELGMAECAPRLFDKTGWEYFFINKLMGPRWRAAYIRWIKKRRVRSPEVTEIPPEGFEANITSYFARALKLNTRVIVSLIAQPSSRVRVKSPHLKFNVDRYNAIYRRVAARFANVTLVDPLGGLEDVDRVTIDDFHVGREGAELIFQAVRSAL